MKQSTYLTVLLLTLSLLGSSCAGDSGPQTASTPEAEQAPAPEPEPEPEPARKASEILVGSWSATPATMAALEKDEKLKAIFKAAEETDKASAFKLMMEVIGFGAVEWTFGADRTASSKVAEYILKAEEAAGQKVRDAEGNLLKKEYKSMSHSGTWSTDSESGNEISITVKGLGVDSQQFSFQVIDDDTVHALIANKSYPFPLSRVK
ncbi:MAG: hypothetical protein VX498_04765 [Myxococcota bacterium]|nr:hypothetical protein [Myxococcota bacterium]